jgi:hypothetical protein
VGSSPTGSNVFMDTAISHGLAIARLELRGQFSAWTFFSAQAAATPADCLRARALCIQRAPHSHRQSRRSDKIHLLGIEVDTKCTCSERNAMNCGPHACFPYEIHWFGAKNMFSYTKIH